ncbi:MAG: lysoplasmalogenase [Alphaproteobacteria bacterium]|nr:lysoplasmalogenase [Alphaproteobacteria bacterium]MCB9792329.1 lysoplasmalogenase [Alphaproteobacteria bacterium]
MMRTETLAAWGFAAAALWFIATWTGTPWLAIAVKPVPALALMLYAWGSGDGRYSRLLAAGFFMSALGDLFLALEGLFLPGLGSFLVAHVLYIVAFSMDRPTLHPLRAIPFALFAGLVLTVLWPGLGDMALPVAVYTCVISTMLWRAAARLDPEEGLRTWVGFMGAGSFALSDSMIAVNLFHTPLYDSNEAVMVTYWLGQLGIAVTTPRRAWLGERGG